MTSGNRQIPFLDIVPGVGSRVNAVAPGPVWTPLNASDKEAKDVSKFGSDVPMKRPAQPEEIAPAYVFLASPQCSSYITGEILPIIGGYSGGQYWRRASETYGETTPARPGAPYGKDR